MTESTGNKNMRTAVKPPLQEFYATINEKCRDITKLSLEGELYTLQGNSQSHASDLETWISVLKDRPECKILASALNEYRFGLFAVVSGLYRYAFVALRLYFELSLSTIYLSLFELELRLRLSGQRDMTWTEINDPDKGLFSANVTKAFCPELLDEVKHQHALAQKVYRECSEYVHGTPALENPIPDTLQFDELLYKAWHNKASTMKMIVTLMLFMRYGSYLNPEMIRVLEPCILDEIGYLQVVRHTIERTQNEQMRLNNE